MIHIARKPNALPLPNDVQIVMTVNAWTSETMERTGENLYTDVLVYNTYREAADKIHSLIGGEGYATEQICTITICCVRKS